MRTMWKAEEALRALVQQRADLEEENASLTGQAMVHHKMIRMVAADFEKYKRRAERAEGTPAIQDAWDAVEEHIDYAYGRIAAQDSERG